MHLYLFVLCGGSWRRAALPQLTRRSRPVATRPLFIESRQIGLYTQKVRQIAPLLIVKTNLTRKKFVAEIPKITALLDPSSRVGGQTAETFEAFFFAAEDANGPFAYTDRFSRNEEGDGEWASNRCLDPYPIDSPGPAGKPCS